MNRRRVMVGAGLVALLGFNALAGPRLYRRIRNGGKVTLRSRVLDYEDAIRRMEPFPSAESIAVDIKALMAEYFSIGVHYDDCIKILKDNNLKINEKYTNERDYRFSDKKIYFNPSIVSIINISTLSFFVTFEYRLGLGFHNSKLDEISASRVGTGP